MKASDVMSGDVWYRRPNKIEAPFTSALTAEEAAAPEAPPQLHSR